jgi:predicted AlkP superfamily pyrophosphatase or phosphodiesterase
MRQKKFFILHITISLFALQISHGQIQNRPKLVVGIVIDQMRADYLDKFQIHYGENGFKRLIRGGFNVRNLHYNYIPTTTGPGHASIFTGTVPKNHGIVGNSWLDRASSSVINCVEDNDYKLVDINGITESPVYSRSPKMLQSQTFSDVLRLNQAGKSKIIGLSIKDRGAILPVGKTADYAFWYNRTNGNFITSTYYAKSLPKWLVTFNSLKMADSLLNQSWCLDLEIEDYAAYNRDQASFKKIYRGNGQSTFPYNLKLLRDANGNFDLITETPFGNTLLTSLAKATIVGEKMGADNVTDFLSISYSSTDYIGHAFGIHSLEVEDAYIKMDKEISILLNFLDAKVGKDDYMVFLTADHAAGEHPVNLMKHGLEGEFFSVDKIKKKVNDELCKDFGEKNYIAYMDKTQLYLSDIALSNAQIINRVMEILQNIQGIENIYFPKSTKNRFRSTSVIFKNSFNPGNSGDVLFQFKPGWMPTRKYGTTHGTKYTYDTHVPLLWYGKLIENGVSNRYHSIDQIVPTLSILLKLPLPDKSNRNPIYEIID